MQKRSWIFFQANNQLIVFRHVIYVLETGHVLGGAIGFFPYYMYYSCLSFKSRFAVMVGAGGLKALHYCSHP